MVRYGNYTSLNRLPTQMAPSTLPSRLEMGGVGNLGEPRPSLLPCLARGLQGLQRLLKLRTIRFGRWRSSKS